MPIIEPSEVYDKNLNFLLGSGASFGVLPTLALQISDEGQDSHSIESLATELELQQKPVLHTLLFMHYYKHCIEPAFLLSFNDETDEELKSTARANYRKFLQNLISVLNAKKQKKRCNLFTTNYDNCLTLVADELLQSGETDFIINDGGHGFHKRFLEARNFNQTVYRSGIFGRHQNELPQLNLIHLHGSVHWYRDEQKIEISYDTTLLHQRCLPPNLIPDLTSFSNTLLQEGATIEQLSEIETSEQVIAQFWSLYSKLPIVNPTKWKFHETVFEEHYYQMLRLLSYELEKPDSVLITFGFSFADEHILNLVKRSLSNPTLQLYVCCFDEDEHAKMTELFRQNRNVSLVSTSSNLDFSKFNEEVFSLQPSPIAPSSGGDEE